MDFIQVMNKNWLLYRANNRKALWKAIFEKDICLMDERSMHESFLKILLKFWRSVNLPWILSCMNKPNHKNTDQVILRRSKHQRNNLWIFLNNLRQIRHSTTTLKAINMNNSNHKKTDPSTENRKISNEIKNWFRVEVQWLLFQSSSTPVIYSGNCFA